MVGKSDLTASLVAVVDKQRKDKMTLNAGRFLSITQPSDMIYLVIASGSTGEPKGAASHAPIISHPHVKY